LNIISRAERLAREALEGACVRAVEQHDVVFAWAGWVDWPRSEVAPVASAGNGSGYLDVIYTSLDGKSALSRGPAGRAARDGRVRTCFDTTRDPDFLPWQHAALNRGFRSIASLPIRVYGEVAAVLCVYAPAPGHFDGLEVARLERLAESIGARLDALVAASAPS
jgi:GAF domain-containing protein